MDQQFKKLLQQSRATSNSGNPLYRTFEGTLFKDSSWYFESETDAVQVTSVDALPLKVFAPESAPAPLKAVAPQKGLAPLCEVLFIGDSYKGEGEDLLGRMISAMKLTPGEFYRFHLNEELENISELADNLDNPDSATKELFNFISEKRPRVVVSLGATVTNVLLGRREKLSGIHGQFFDKNIDECYFSLMPLFHPDFLVINPNMKRTAWIDLQKVMERVGKI